MQIGIALSGGGYRALVFHLGVLARLACSNHLDEIAFISTVSGGSLATALIYAMNDYRFPSSREFIEQVVPNIRTFLAKHNLKREIRSQILRHPTTWLRKGGGNQLAVVLLKSWGLSRNLQDIPDQPRWIINATTYETRVNWHFMSRRMGDYQFGYCEKPDIALANAVAASAAHPFIGAFDFDTAGFEWFRYLEGSQTETEPITPKHSHLMLWDGGIYDGLGAEPLIKPGGKFRPGIDFLIVSDASVPISVPRYWLAYPSAHYLIDMLAYQIQALRARFIMEYIKKQPTAGRYIKLGHTASFILKEAHKDGELPDLRNETFTDQQIEEVMLLKTTDTFMPVERFDLIFRHGFEVADLTLYAHGADDDGFSFVGFNSL